MPKVNQSRACLWQQSIANLQTFSYEVEINPHKKALNSFLKEKKDCTLYRLIKTFKKNMINYYCIRSNEQFLLKPEIQSKILFYTEKIDEAVLAFVSILVQIIPKFFLDLPGNLEDIEGIVRNAIISDEILTLLVLVRKESFQDIRSQYINGLESFEGLPIKSGIWNKFENDREENYIKAMQSLVDITHCNSIGDIHDSVAMLMNYISMGLFDEKKPDYEAEDDELIQAFLLIIGKSNTPDLPLYVSILNKFLDNHTLDFKGIGQGITKLTFIVNNSKDWSSFISV